MGAPTYIFDIDFTLYPFNQSLDDWIGHRITSFIAEKLSIEFDDANRLRNQYYDRYGTSLLGLLAYHNISAREYREFVDEQIPLELVDICHDSIAAVREIDAPVYALTNGSRVHGERIIRYLGLSDKFIAIRGIDDAGYYGKPWRKGIQKFINEMNIDTNHAVIFEDSPRNLEIPKAMGMTTVLVGDRPRAAWVDIHENRLPEAIDKVAKTHE